MVGHRGTHFRRIRYGSLIIAYPNPLTGSRGIRGSTTKIVFVQFSKYGNNQKVAEAISESLEPMGQAIDG